MTGLADIGVQVESASSMTGAAPAVLREIESMLVELIECGTVGRIDLRSLPLSPADLDWLAGALGEGEVQASVETMGSSDVLETGVFGVWWVRHFDEGGNVTADFIEVTQLPELLKTHPADVQAGLARLREQMNTLQNLEEGDGHVR
jgi:hypothetical protein